MPLTVVVTTGPRAALVTSTPLEGDPTTHEVAADSTQTFHMEDEGSVLAIVDPGEPLEPAGDPEPESGGGGHGIPPGGS